MCSAFCVLAQYNPVADSCEHGNEHSGSTKGGCPSLKIVR
jgi:hypothetical protein